MKARKPLRRISEKRLKELNGSGFSGLHHNSTIARNLCNAITAARKSSSINLEQSGKTQSGQTPMDLYSVESIENQYSQNRARKPLKERSGKERKPIKKQSEKQRTRLKRLAEVRRKWWEEAEKSGDPLKCGICNEPIYKFEQLASDHIEPGHGKSDSETNLQPAHFT
jgi:hypothetical protein